MNVATVLDVKQVVIGLEANSKEEVIKQLADSLYQKGVLVNKERYIESVLAREKHATTGIGNGIAIPHGKSDGVSKVAIAYAKLKKPIEWESLDNKPVLIVIMLAIPNAEKSEVHLRLLSELAVKLMDDELVEALKNETNEVKIINLLG